MIDYTRDMGRVRNPVLLVSAVTWIVLLAGPASTPIFAHCPAGLNGTMHWPASFQMLLAMSSPLSLATGWALMLLAMMLPALIAPIQHVRLQSFNHRRWRSITLFLSGYAIVWMAIGGAILTMELALRVSAPQSVLPAAAAFLVAMIWQFSPIKQRFLNRCHNHSPLAAFGIRADLDALRFGLLQGGWCAGSCWALMLFPMLLPQGHVVAMAIVTLLIFSERLEHPRPLSWRWRGAGKAIRILIAQARILLRAY
jgi:predicted metal-binding membrane protein